MLGLPYMKPEPLVHTTGANWEYQPDPSLKQILRRELKNHYENFTLGRFDKLNIPLYLFLSGAGTGKSRNATEFHQTAITCLSAPEDGELLTRIKEAWVFLVSYENGFALRTDEPDPYFAIGTRMLFQLLREKMMLHEIIEAYKPPDPLNVVPLIAKYHNRDLKNVTVILVVDGMQQLMKNKDDGLKIDSQFHRTLTSIAALAFQGIFVIPVCTSTITGSIKGTLRYSPRKCIYLPVASLQPPNVQQGDSLVPVFKNDEITNTLVEDCGGHGRALEALNDCLAGRNIEECNIDTLMNDLRYNLTEKYRDAIFSSVEDARPIARAILTRRLLNRYKPIPKTDKTPDEIAGGGLIRFEQIENSPMGYLTAPYIWLWIFVEISQPLGDPILRIWDTELPKQSGIVDRKAFTNFFGPFAGRACKSTMAKPKLYTNGYDHIKRHYITICNQIKNIHTASLGQLCNVNQISKERTKTIITKSFENIANVNVKTKIPINILNILENFYFRKGLRTISRILP